MKLSHAEYSIEQVKRMIIRYHELRSAAEIGAVRYEMASGRGRPECTHDVVCILVDLDQAISNLSGRAHDVAVLLKEGATYEEVANRLNVCTPTVKFHFYKSLSRIITYLNKPGGRRHEVLYSGNDRTGLPLGASRAR